MNNDYKRPGLFGGFSLFPPVIKYLLIVNVGVFLLQHFFIGSLRFGNANLGEGFLKLFALQPIMSGKFFPWQLITYMFMHADFTHLFFNMFALWMFGMELENLWGSKKFLIYYTICGLGAAIANLFIAPLFSLVGPTIGASGSVYGVLIAFGYLFPNRYIYIYFMIPIKAWILVILYIGLEVFAVASQSQSGIAHIAHLGGAVVGIIYLLLTNKSKMSFVNNFKKSKFSSFTSNPQNYGKPFSEPKSTGYNANSKDINEKEYVNEYDLQQKISQGKIDTILDKLSQSGYQSLTEEEKKILFEESKKLR